MRCPFCSSSQIAVTNSRPTMENSQIWRRRKCLDCNELFTTHEVIDLTHLVIIKRSGKKEKYSRVKLYSGIYNATVSSRPTERQKLVERITRSVEKQILYLKKKEIDSKDIGEIVLNTLQKLSPGAFLAFLTYYKNITTKSQIKKELKHYLK